MNNYFKEYSDIKKSEEYLYELLEDFDLDEELEIEIYETLDLIQDIKKDIRTILLINTTTNAHNK